MTLAARGVTPQRMAREVEAIAREWRGAPEIDPEQANAWLDELVAQLSSGVEDAEEALSDVDHSEPAAVKQAQGTLDALVATRAAAARALAAI